VEKAQLVEDTVPAVEEARVVEDTVPAVEEARVEEETVPAVHMPAGQTVVGPSSAAVAAVVDTVDTEPAVGTEVVDTAVAVVVGSKEIPEAGKRVALHSLVLQCRQIPVTLSV
jgi:hypothetical protein